MALPYELHLARRDLGRCPWLTAGMILGLAVAVVAMVYIPNTMASFYDDLVDRIVEQNSSHITVWPREKRDGSAEAGFFEQFGPNVDLQLVDQTSPRHRWLNGHRALSKQIAGVEGVSAIAGFAKGNATLSKSRVNLGVDLEGIVPHEYARVVNISEHFPEGRVPRLGPADIAIGFRAAEKLGIHIGEHVTVATPKTQMLMRVRAIFKSGYYGKDMNHSYVALSTAQRMFRMGNEISGLAVRCRDMGEAVAVSGVLKETTGKKIRNWRDDNASLLAQVKTINRVTAFIDVLVALVSAAGMASVFSVFVLSRQKELAILRAVGAAKASLRSILMIEAMFIWAIGTVIGFTIVLGIMAYEQIHPFKVSAETCGIDSFATVPRLEAFVMAGILAACTMMGSAWWSGRRAARLNPIEVIFGR